MDEKKYPTLLEFKNKIESINNTFTRALSYSNTFIQLNKKFSLPENQKISDKYNPFFTFYYFWMRDLLFLELSHLIDKNSKWVDIFLIFNFLKNNYKKLNLEWKEYFLEQDFYETFIPIKYKEIESLEDKLLKSNELFGRIKTFRDKKICHQDKLPENFKMITFDELEKLDKLMMSLFNEIDLRFFSNQTSNSFIKDQISNSLNLLFSDLHKNVWKK